MSLNVVATRDYVTGITNNLNERLTHHEERYKQTYFILTDKVNGLEYIVEIHNGTLISYCKCVGIRVTKLPDKTSGEFDPAGMVVVAELQDGSIIEITDYTISPVIDGIVTVSYEQAGEIYTTTFETEAYTISVVLQDFEYTENEDGTYTLTGWKQTLNGKPSTECVIPDIEDGLIIVEVA